jgi:hypothetical protein
MYSLTMLTTDLTIQNGKTEALLLPNPPIGLYVDYVLPNVQPSTVHLGTGITEQTERKCSLFIIDIVGVKPTIIVIHMKGSYDDAWVHNSLDGDFLAAAKGKGTARYSISTVRSVCRGKTAHERWR